MIDLILDFIMMVLSIFIASHVLAMHTAPWVLIALYWIINALRYFRKAMKDDVSGTKS